MRPELTWQNKLWCMKVGCLPIVSSANPSTAYQYTGMDISFRTVSAHGSEHAIYTYLRINSAQTSEISTSNVLSEDKLNLKTPATRCLLLRNQRPSGDYGTVGADIGSSGAPALNQYVNVNYKGSLAAYTTSSKAHCNSVGSGGYPPSVDTGGEVSYRG